MSVKILTLDIETRPWLAYGFDIWNTNIHPDNILEPIAMISFAAKWFGSNKVIFRSTFHDGKMVMLKELHALLSEADIIITYNGKRFDVPHWNREFAEADMLPPAPYRHIDLDETMKRVFKFESHRLNYVTRRLGLGQKTKHEGMPLWLACINGDEKAWARMRKYNKQDVRITEELYVQVRPWIKNHPSIAHESNGSIVCTTCGSDNWKRNGNAYTQTSVYPRYHCRDCGNYFRGTARSNVGGTGVSQVTT